LSAVNKREFRGKTETDVEAQVSEWRHQNAGRVRVVREHPIEQLPATLLVKQPNYQKHDLPDAWSQVVEYRDVEPAPAAKSPRPKTRARRPKKKSPR
jgi:hypothetical protein